MPCLPPHLLLQILAILSRNLQGQWSETKKEETPITIYSQVKEKENSTSRQWLHPNSDKGPNKEESSGDDCSFRQGMRVLIILWQPILCGRSAAHLARSQWQHLNSLYGASSQTEHFQMGQRRLWHCAKEVCDGVGCSHGKQAKHSLCQILPEQKPYIYHQWKSSSF